MHLILPLCFRRAAYNDLLLAFDGHSNTRRSSPGGAFTLLHPVVSAKSSFRWFDTASFHCSLSPWYLRLLISLVVLLYRYNQQERSGSFTTDVFLALVGFQISLVFGTVVYGCSVLTVLSVLICSGVGLDVVEGFG